MQYTIPFQENPGIIPSQVPKSSWITMIRYLIVDMDDPYLPDGGFKHVLWFCSSLSGEHIISDGLEPTDPFDENGDMSGVHERIKGPQVPTHPLVGWKKLSFDPQGPKSVMFSSLKKKSVIFPVNRHGVVFFFGGGIDW